MSKEYYYEEKDFKLIQGDSFKILKGIEPKSIDMIFADPPYFLSSDGISCSGGKMVSVNKGDWDKSISIEKKHKFNKGTPSLAGRSLLKNSPPDCFLIHPLRSALWQFAGLCPTPHQRLCLWNPQAFVKA